MKMDCTQVVIVGGGPNGIAVAHYMGLYGIDWARGSRRHAMRSSSFAPIVLSRRSPRRQISSTSWRRWRSRSRGHELSRDLLTYGIHNERLTMCPA